MAALVFAMVSWLAPPNAPEPPPVTPPPADAWTWDGPSPDQLATWDALAQCESGGQWDIDALHDGGLQFHPGTWLRWKDPADPPFAWQADSFAQILAADRLRAHEVEQGRGGYGPWPGCARKLGLPR